MSGRIDWAAVALALLIAVPAYCALVALAFVVWLAR